MNNLAVEISKDNKEIFKINKNGKWIYLGSRYRVARDIKSILDILEKVRPQGTLVVFGLATGEYILPLLNKASKDTNIIIIEPSEDIAKRFVECSKNKYSSHLNLKLFLYDDETLKLLKDYSHDNYDYGVTLIDYPGYKNVFNLEFSKVKEVIFQGEQEKILKNRTFNRFVKTWLINSIESLKYFTSSISINALKDKYKKIPAIIVGAGPSLTKNIELLKDLKDKAIIISGGRTLKPLLSLCVDPDFLSVVDVGDISLKLLDGALDKTRSALLYNELLPESILSHFDKKIYNNHNKTLLPLLNNEIDNLTSGGSVIHTATNLALHLGCNPIIFIGEDLAFTGEKHHSDISNNTLLLSKELAIITKETLSKSNESLKELPKKKGLYVKDIFGGEVRTSEALFLFKTQLEDIIANFKDTSFVNCTEGGAMINGTTTKSLSTFLNLPKLVKKTYFSKIDNNKILNKNKLILLMETLIENCNECLSKTYAILRYLSSLDFKNEKFLTIDSFDKKINSFNIHRFKDMYLLNTIFTLADLNIKSDIAFDFNEKSDTSEIILEKLLNKNISYFNYIKEQLEFLTPLLSKELYMLKN